MKGIKGTAYAKESFEILNGSTIASFMESLGIVAIAASQFIIIVCSFLFSASLLYTNLNLIYTK